MKLGVPNFSGQRLREGREARDVSVLSLSETAGISRQSIHSYESAAQAPQIEVLSRISERLDLPIRFFTLPPRPAAAEVPNFRARAATTISEKKRVWWRYRWLSDIVETLGEWVEFPLFAPDDFGVRQYDALEDDEIESLAIRVRAAWGLGVEPIDNLMWLAESHGVIVGRDDLGVQHVDAMSRWVDGRPQALLESSSAAPARERLSLAHELFHILARHDPTQESTVKRLAKRREEQAMRFAGAFLLPGPAFAECFGIATLDAFAAMKETWGISIGALIKRARHLDFVSEEEERRLWINYTRRGYRQQEPLDDRMEQEKPYLLNQAFDAVCEGGLSTKEKICEALARTPKDIETLAGLSVGYLKPIPPKPLLRIVPRS